MFTVEYLSMREIDGGVNPSQRVPSFLRKQINISGLPTSLSQVINNMKNNWKDDFRKSFINWKLHHYSVPCVKDEFVINEVESFIESLLAEQSKELAEKVDIELRRILAEELPILEKKIREEQKKELLEEVEKATIYYYNDKAHFSEEDISTIINKLRV